MVTGCLKDSFPYIPHLFFLLLNLDLAGPIPVFFLLVFTSFCTSPLLKKDIIKVQRVQLNEAQPGRD